MARAKTSTTMEMTAMAGEPARLRMRVSGMTCADCERQVERALREAGAEDIAVNHRNDEVMFAIRDVPDHAALIRVVEAAGYQAEVAGHATTPRGAGRQRLRDRLSLQGSTGTGLIAGLTSTLCCVPAAAAFALGLSGSSFLVSLGLYRPYFLVAGVAFAILAIWWNLRRSERCCSVDQHQRNQVLIPAITLGTFVLSYIAINRLLLPWLYS